jgi:hypothetical protein
MTVSHDLEGMWKEAVVAYFKGLCLCLGRATEEIHHSLSGCAVLSQPTFEPSTSQIQVTGATVCTNLLGGSLHKTEGKRTKLFINYRNMKLPKCATNPVLLLVKLGTPFS